MKLCESHPERMKSPGTLHNDVNTGPELYARFLKHHENRQQQYGQYRYVLNGTRKKWQTPTLITLIPHVCTMVPNGCL